MALILLADDDTALRDLVRRTLEADQHRVIAGQDGGEALDAISANGASIDLIMTDVDMPGGVDGIEVANQALAKLPSVKVILMSGFAGLLDRAADLDQKRVSSISKPFTLDAIKQAVRQALA